MKLNVLGIVLLALGSLAGCATMESPGQMVAAARNLDHRFIKEFNEGDVNELMEMYWNSPDLVVFSPDGSVIRGWAGARDMYVKALAAMPGGKLELTDTNYRVEGGVVYAWGTWRMTVPASQGNLAEDVRGCYSEVDARRDGKMVYLLDHPALVLPHEPPATAPAR